MVIKGSASAQRVLGSFGSMKGPGPSQPPPQPSFIQGECLGTGVGAGRAFAGFWHIVLAPLAGLGGGKAEAEFHLVTPKEIRGLLGSNRNRRADAVCFVAQETHESPSWWIVRHNSRPERPHPPKVRRRQPVPSPSSQPLLRGLKHALSLCLSVVFSLRIPLPFHSGVAVVFGIHHQRKRLLCIVGQFADGCLTIKD